MEICGTFWHGGGIGGGGGGTYWVRGWSGKVPVTHILCTCRLPGGGGGVK